MKKMIAILLSVLTLFAVCACSKGEPRTETKTDDYTPDYGELYYASGDTKFGIMDPAEEVLNALGEPVNGTFESDSCAYQGKDYFYYYDGFEVMVNDVDGVKRITGITVADDTVQTPQGLKIGMKLEDAQALLTGEYKQVGDVYKIGHILMLRQRAGVFLFVLHFDHLIKHSISPYTTLAAMP